MALGSYDLQIIVSALDKATGPLKTIGAQVKGEAKAMAGQLTASGEAGKKLRADLTELGSSATQTGAQIAGMGAAVVGGLGMAVKTGMDFKAGMAEVSTLVDTTQVSMANLENGVRSLATQTGQSAQTLTGGLYQAISAGVDAGHAVEFLGTAAKAAVGGVTDTKTAVDGMTTVMNAWGKSAADATDIADSMFIAVKAGKTTFEELSHAYAYIAGTAANAGMSIDETNAALAAMTTQGLRTDMAARSLNMALLSIMTPSKDAADLAKKLGVNLSETALKEKGLVGVMQDLERATGGSVEKMATLLGSSEAARAGLALAGTGGEKFAETLDAMGKKAGASGEAYDKMAASGAQSFARLKASVTELAISIADVLEPVVSSLARALKPVLDVMGWIVKTPIGKALVVGAAAFGTIAVAAGGALIVLGQVAGAVSNVGRIAQLVTSGELATLIGSLKTIALQAKAAATGMLSTGSAAAKATPFVARYGAALKAAGVAAVAYAAGAKLASVGEGMYAKGQEQGGLGGAVKRVGGKLIGGTVAGNIAKAMGGKKLSAKDIVPILAAFEKRALGGPVKKDLPYLVGEQGPELFLPQTSGTIYPGKRELLQQAYEEKFLTHETEHRGKAMEAAQVAGASRLRDIIEDARRNRLAGAKANDAPFLNMSLQQMAEWANGDASASASSDMFNSWNDAWTAKGGTGQAMEAYSSRAASAGSMRGDTITIKLEDGLIADKTAAWATTPSGERLLVRVIGKTLRQAVGTAAAPA